MNKIFTTSLIMLFALCMTWAWEAQAQTWDEFFRQKETQREYLLLQIGALRIQSGLIQEAAQVASFGLNTIRAWRAGELTLHRDFFNAHSHLGPLATRSLDCLISSNIHPDLLAERIRKSRSYWLDQSRDILFVRWTEKIHGRMLDRIEFLSAELEGILGNGLQAEDAERAEWIDGLGKQLLQLHQDLGALQQSAQVRMVHQNFRDYELLFLNRY